jgi:hypothetical protein
LKVNGAIVTKMIQWKSESRVMQLAIITALPPTVFILTSRFLSRSSTLPLPTPHSRFVAITDSKGCLRRIPDLGSRKARRTGPLVHPNTRGGGERVDSIAVLNPWSRRLDACDEHFGFIFITSPDRSIQITLVTMWKGESSI